MKIANFLIVAFIAISLNISCNAQASKDNNSETSVKGDKVEVFYFHFTRRCTTCRTVENIARESVDELYGNDVIFDAFDLETTVGKEKGEKLGVSGQTLLIVKGDERIDITTDGFMNAHNPEKLKEIIKGKITPLL